MVNAHSLGHCNLALRSLETVWPGFCWLGMSTGLKTSLTPEDHASRHSWNLKYTSQSLPLEAPQWWLQSLTPVSVTGGSGGSRVWRVLLLSGLVDVAVLLSHKRNPNLRAGKPLAHRPTVPQKNWTFLLDQLISSSLYTVKLAASVFSLWLSFSFFLCASGVNTCFSLTSQKPLFPEKHLGLPYFSV